MSYGPFSGGGGFGGYSGTGSNPFSSSSGGYGSSFSSYYQQVKTYDIAHGVLMGVTVAVLYPLGSIFMRLGGNIWVHAFIQMFSFLAMVAGLGLGVVLAQHTRLLFNNTHTILGVVVVCLFLLQPLFGIIHHEIYKRSQSRNTFSHIHIWYGRILMILAIVNGGLGLQLASRFGFKSTAAEIAYGVVAGVMFLLYVFTVCIRRKGGSRKVATGGQRVRSPSRRSGLVRRKESDGNHSHRSESTGLYTAS